MPHDIFVKKIIIILHKLYTYDNNKRQKLKRKFSQAFRITSIKLNLAEKVGSVGLEDSSLCFVGGSESALEDGESDTLSDELPCVGSSAFLFEVLALEDSSSNDDEGLALGLVSTGHLGV